MKRQILKLSFVVLVTCMCVTNDMSNAGASGWYRCRCSLTCDPVHKRIGIHHSYNALSEAAAGSMCLSDATEDCLKKYGGTSTSDPVARCE